MNRITERRHTVADVSRRLGISTQSLYAWTKRYSSPDDAGGKDELFTEIRRLTQELASVSEEVDAKIREQIKAGVFPVRLSAKEWDSGNINWLLDVIAPNQKLTTSVIANFKQIIKEGDLRIHPLITRLVDPETLKKMGAAPVGKSEDA